MKIIMWLVIYLVIVCITSPSATDAYDDDGYHHHHDHHKYSSSSPEVVVINLTHHHSIHSPTYLNHSQTITDRANFDFHTSLQRAASIYPRSSSSDYIVSGITGWNGAGFLAHLQVGSKSMRQNVVMDTGSGLLWINCAPTTIRVPPEPMFNPRRSTSYALADCDTTQACRRTGPLRITCKRDSPIEEENGCQYYGLYAEDKFISGNLSVENFGFVNNTTTQVLHGVVFGCTHDTNMNKDVNMNKDPINLFRQVTDKAYCLAVLPAPPNLEDNKVSIMGILMQQLHYIGFDLARNKFVFHKYADCRLIGE